MSSVKGLERTRNKDSDHLMSIRRSQVSGIFHLGYPVESLAKPHISENSLMSDQSIVSSRKYRRASSLEALTIRPMVPPVCHPKILDVRLPFDFPKSLPKHK